MVSAAIAECVVIVVMASVGGAGEALPTGVAVSNRMNEEEEITAALVVGKHNEV